jgi:hypothetical protein
MCIFFSKPPIPEMEIITSSPTSYEDEQERRGWVVLGSCFSYRYWRFKNEDVPTKDGLLWGSIKCKQACKRMVITRQGVPHTLGRAWWPRPISFAVFCGAREFLVIGYCRGSSGGGECATRAVSDDVFFRRQLLFWVFSCIVFLLTVCYALVLILSSVYVNAEAPLCWLDFFSSNYLYLVESFRLLFGCTPLGWLIFTYMHGDCCCNVVFINESLTFLQKKKKERVSEKVGKGNAGLETKKRFMCNCCTGL